MPRSRPVRSTVLTRPFPSPERHALDSWDASRLAADVARDCWVEPPWPGEEDDVPAPAPARLADVLAACPLGRQARRRQDRP